MMPPPLEDRLNRLADHVAAPATPDARQAIGRRTARLRRRRRRRQVRNAVGGGLVALLVLAGAAALQANDPDVETDIAGPGELPALTVDLDGWQIVDAEDTTAAPDTADVYDPASGSLQVFRRPDDLAGPSVFLRHEGASDPVAETPAAERVTIGGSQGYLEQTGPDRYTVSWNPAQTDSHAYLEARGLERGEVVDFANGLRLKDPDIHYPPTPGTRFGFDAQRPPKGLEEVPVSPASPGSNTVRHLVAERPGATIEITIDDRGVASFETHLGRLLAAGGAAEEVSVLGHPAVLVEHPDGRWSLVWRQTDEATVIASLSDVDRSAVDDFVGGLDEISEGEWQDLKAAQPAPPATASTVPAP
jgi:hypothetical protein